MNHRVKKRDFVKLANFSRIKRGLKPTKSSTTVFNSARPQNKRSSQAKKHIGLGLFCSKKPPKLQENDNLLTHYQRASRPWISLCNDGLLKKLTVADLNKYLLHNKMVHCLKLKKSEKNRIIQGHIVSTSNNEANFEEWEDGQDDVSSISSIDRDYDIVLCDTNMSDDQQSSEDSGDNVENIFTKTRSGRIVTNWRISKYT